VNVSEAYSGVCNVTCGVPQGSSLRPISSLVHLNDFSASIDPDCKDLLYSDDTAVLFSQSNQISLRNCDQCF
jgi:hypothetical protein